uniref:Interactor of little elongation complex ELL subunit 1 n=1 Tax=Moschus moschiferus TaxID=68415 RepID=A0A8C6FSI9_MOSMO
MMPGETHSAAPGAAADLSRCQGCASLQQNLNEYVDALITLKQKIINTDNLLTEYQKKCDELQFARRENSTLHHQVEQMLQKISPLQKCQEELGFLKAELEEKKSSLKLYQDTHQEYARVKEECLKTDAQKKKLEAKVKKLEEAAVKQTQDFKQLRNEKKILEKEFKKTQERLDEFSKQKNERELRHIGTQISSDSSGSIDKRKVKLLLKELWLCINTTHRLPGEGGRCIPEKPAQENRRSIEFGEDGVPPAAGGSLVHASAVQTCLAELSMEIEGDFSACEDVGGAAGRGNNLSEEAPNPEAAVWRSEAQGPGFDEDLQAAVDFFRLPPPLLSPVPSPPLASPPHLGVSPSLLAPEPFFGEGADSSDYDSAPRRNSEPVSEDDLPEAQDHCGSSGETKGAGAWEERPHTCEAAPALGAGTTLGFGTFSATLREPAASFTFAREQLWAMSSELGSGREKGVVDERGRYREVGRKDRLVPTVWTRPTALGGEPAETLLGGLAREEGAARGWLDPCPPPLGLQPLREPRAPEGKTLPSPGIASPKLELARWTFTDGTASESRWQSASGGFQGHPSALEKERGATQGCISGAPPAPGAVELGLGDAWSCSSGLGASPRCGCLPSPSGLEDGSGPTVPPAISPCGSEQTAPTARVTVVEVPPKPPGCASGGARLESSFPALSPVSGASGPFGQRSGPLGCAAFVKDLGNAHSLPQPLFPPRSAFPGAACVGLAAGQALRVELTPARTGFTVSPGPPSSSVSSGFGFGRSASWHHSDLLRGGEESPRATWSSEGGGSASASAGEDRGPAAPRAPASVLPNQVSVITKQVRPGPVQPARPEPPAPAGSEPASATHGDARTGWTACGARPGRESGAPAQSSARSPASGAPTSWGRLDFDAPGGSFPVETSHHPTDCKFLLSSENIPFPNRDTVTDATVQEEAQKRSPSLPATGVDTASLDVDKRPDTELTLSRGFPAGDAVRCPGVALVVSQAPPALQHGPKERLQLESESPGGAPPEGLGTAETASPRAAPCCYSGIREAGGADTEAEESEAPSGSEGEPEPDPAPEPGLQGSPGAAEAGPSVEVGSLTSALQDFNISTLSEMDRLSTSEVVMFLESCQLRDYSSADSVSECSSKGTLNRGMNEELKHSGPSGEGCGSQLCEEEALETSEEWAESEEEDCPLRGQLPRCSLETLSEVLTRLGQELQASQEDSEAEEAARLLLFRGPESVTAEHLQQQLPPLDTAIIASPTPRASVHTQGGPPACAGSGHENKQSTPERHVDVDAPAGNGEEVPSEPTEPSVPNTDPGAGSGEVRLQCQISTVTSEVINVLVNKDQNLVIEKGDNWTIISGLALMPELGQVALCDAPEGAPLSTHPEELAAGFLSASPVERSPEAGCPGSPLQEPPSVLSVSGTQEDISNSGLSGNFDKSRLRNRPVKPSVRISSEIYDQNFESQTAPFDHTYYNSKLEPLGKNKNRSKVSNRDQSNKPVKTPATGRVEATQHEVSPSFSGDRGHGKPQRSHTQTILATADTSTPADGCVDTLSKIRQEVGPPLPPLLAPLIATPPRTSRPASPLISSSSPSSPLSPLCPNSPSSEPPVPPMTSPPPEEPGPCSPPCASPSLSSVPTGDRVLSSPLQFCAATPKHALPVPGRLPRLAPAHPVVAAPPENSVKILDTMYPELSARARTLNILKGNIQLTRGPPADRKGLPGPVGTIAGFQAIASSSTAFVKAGGSSGGDGKQDKAGGLGPPQDLAGKRTLSASVPRSAKRLRLDSGSPELEPTPEGAGHSPRTDPSQAAAPSTEDRHPLPPTQLPPSPEETVESPDTAIAEALRKIGEATFDLLPVIRSHVYVGNISTKPVMRDQEKDVVYEFSTTKKHLAESLLHSILSELKSQKMSVEHNYIHALCRVYVGVCRQLGDLERARLFCYGLLKEDFPESEKLTLFVANMWRDVFLSQSAINKAMQLVARQRAKGEVLNCLRAFLNWEKNAPVDVGFMVSKLLLTIQLCPKTEFQPSARFGEDLSDSTWEYVCAIDLLCCHQKWVWTHDNIISKELWPVMDKWIKYRKGHPNIAYIPDIIIASALRLIGRLGQLGLKEGFPSAVKNISTVIGMFIQHAQDEDIPWGVQLAAVYALCDLSPSNPAEISKILEAWRRETARSVPAAVLGALDE